MTPLVVLIDDDVDLLFLLTRHLEKLGAKTRTFSTATEAAAFLDQNKEPLAAVCLDLGLPDQSGFDVCARLKADPRLTGVPIIFMSGRTGLDDEARALEVGADAFLKKPFRTKAFLDRMKPLVAQTHAAVPEVNG